MKKRYVCLVCYGFHPEMKGISEEEFNAGDNVCKEEKCKRRGESLNPVYSCDECGKLYPVDEEHAHAH